MTKKSLDQYLEFFWDIQNKKGLFEHQDVKYNLQIPSLLHFQYVE